jgi:hypothetical protein
VSDTGILDTVARQARAAVETAHRPWPLPEAPWAQAQTRRDVLLAYWPVALGELARLLPPELAVDTFGGEAWLGISAYRVTGLRVRGLPPLPGLSSFPQLEVFACVTLDDRPGVWLCSLETPKGLIVEAVKRAHRLPAYRARVSAVPAAGGIRFEVDRDGLELRTWYAGVGAAAAPQPGTLEAFLAERFALYTADGGRLYRAELHHPPWLLRRADVTVETATLSPLALEGAPAAWYAEVQDVLLWPLEEL